MFGIFMFFFGLVKYFFYLFYILNKEILIIKFLLCVIFEIYIRDKLLILNRNLFKFIKMFFVILIY